MIKDEYLNINIYDHLTNYFNQKGVGIVTRDEYIFYTQTEKYTHTQTLKELSKLLNIKNYMEEITLFSQGDFFLISVPYKINLKQCDYLLNILFDIDKYNQENKNKIRVSLFTKENNIKESQDLVPIIYELSLLQKTKTFTKNK